MILDSAEKELKLMVDESVRNGEVPYTIAPKSADQENLDSSKNKSTFVLKTTASRNPKFEMNVKFYIVSQGLLRSIFYVFSCEFYTHQVVIPIDSDFQNELKVQLSQTNFIVKSILIILNSSISSKESLLTFTRLTELLQQTAEEAAKKREISDEVIITPNFNIEKESFDTDDENLKAVSGYTELPLRIEKGPIEAILTKGKDPMSGMIKVKVNQKEVKGNYVQIEFPLENRFNYIVQLLLFLQDNMFK